jgi:hypothetical protein
MKWVLHRSFSLDNTNFVDILGRFWADFGSILRSILVQFWSDFRADWGPDSAPILSGFYDSISSRIWADFGANFEANFGTDLEPNLGRFWGNFWATLGADLAGGDRGCGEPRRAKTT